MLMDPGIKSSNGLIMMLDNESMQTESKLQKEPRNIPILTGPNMPILATQMMQQHIPTLLEQSMNLNFGIAASQTKKSINTTSQTCNSTTKANGF